LHVAEQPPFITPIVKGSALFWEPRPLLAVSHRIDPYRSILILPDDDDDDDDDDADDDLQLTHIPAMG